MQPINAATQARSNGLTWADAFRYTRRSLFLHGLQDFNATILAC